MNKKTILNGANSIALDDTTLLYHLEYSLSEILRFYVQFTLHEKEINPNHPSENFKDEINESFDELKDIVIDYVNGLIEEYKKHFYDVDDLLSDLKIVDLNETQ